MLNYSLNFKLTNYIVHKNKLFLYNIHVVQKILKCNNAEHKLCNTVKPPLFGPHLSGLFTYPDTCLGTNYNLIDNIESGSLIRIFSYPDSQLGKGCVRINEVPLYMQLANNWNSGRSTCIN